MKWTRAVKIGFFLIFTGLASISLGYASQILRTKEEQDDPLDIDALGRLTGVVDDLRVIGGTVDHADTTQETDIPPPFSRRRRTAEDGYPGEGFRQR